MLKQGKLAANIGAWVKALAVALLAILVFASLAKQGIPRGVATASTSVASLTGFLAVAIGFSFVGFEIESGAADEIVDPQKDIPSGFTLLWPSFVRLFAPEAPPRERTLRSGVVISATRSHALRPPDSGTERR